MRRLLGLRIALAGADRAAGRHHARRPELLQPPGHDRIVAGVDEHREAVGHELLGRLERADRVGQQRLRVAEHLELHPVGRGAAQVAEDFAAQPGHADGVVGREAAGRVGQERVAAGSR